MGTPQYERQNPFKISFLQGLTALTHLNLESNQLTDISFLHGLTALTDLNLYSNPIQYIPKEIYEQDNVQVQKKTGFCKKYAKNLIKFVLWTKPLISNGKETVRLFIKE